MKIRPLDVSYSQVAVFLTALQQPFNDWTEQHVRQGFAWRPGSVSFATLEQSGPIDVEVVRQAVNPQQSRAERIIVVPFEVDDSGDIEVASIADGQAVSLPPGNYRLTFEHGLKDDGDMWCRFSFEPTPSKVASQVVRADAALAPAEPLVMEAQPAG